MEQDIHIVQEVFDFRIAAQAKEQINKNAKEMTEGQAKLWTEICSTE